MSRVECERWTGLFDRQTVEDALDEIEAQFLASHPRGCAECAAELSTWQGLVQPNEGRISTASARALTLELRDRITVESTAKGTKKFRRASSWLAPVGGLTMAAALLVWWGTRQKSQDPAVSARVVLVQGAGGDVAVGQALQQSAQLRTPAGAVCLDLAGGVRACLAQAGRATLEILEEPRRALRLEQGLLLLRLAHQPIGHSVTVVTPEGRVTAIGTVFSVERSSTGAVVHVSEGRVRVEPSRGEPLTLAAGESVSLPSILRAPFVPSAIETELANLAGALITARTTAEPPAGGDGSPEPSTSPERTSLRSSSTSSSPSSAPLKVPSAQDKLEEARALRKSGQHLAALRAFDAIAAAYGRQSSGRTALVSAADLALSQLGDPGGALARYNRYLATGDQALAEEAAYGRVRSLRALGRRLDEQHAISDMLRDHPRGMYAPALRARLQALDVQHSQ